jgi:hypothetical protein
MPTSDLSTLSLNDLMQQIGGALPGSPERAPLEAEYQRRKFVWLRAAVVIAGVAVAVGCVAVFAGLLRPQAPVAVATAPAAATAVVPAAVAPAAVMPASAQPAPAAPAAATAPQTAAVPAFTREILSREPEIGKLPTGASVLVDDGTCPAGMIKQVVGGSMSAGVPRTRSCVARP